MIASHLMIEPWLMREIVLAETFSPNIGASTQAAFRVDKPKQKQDCASYLELFTFSF